MSDKLSKPKLRISSILASARDEAENGFGPEAVASYSLENPSRPKTPASFDDMPTTNASLNFMNLRTSAASKSRSVISKSHQAKASRSIASQPRSVLSEENINVEPVVSRVSPTAISPRFFVPTSKSAESGFNPSQLLNDLSYAKDTLIMNPKVVINEELDQEIEALIKFLQPLDSSSVLSADLTNSIEDIIMKLSEIPLSMLQHDDTDPLQILSILRLNLRILVKMFETAILPTSPNSATGTGVFDLSLVSMVVSQCTQALLQVCAAHYATDLDGTASLQLVALLSSESEEVPNCEDTYQNLDDCDIEEEDEDGTFVQVRPTTASSTSYKPGKAIAQTNGDIVGVSQLNALLTLLWPRAYDIIKLLSQHSHYSDFTQENTNILESMLQTATNVYSVYKLVSAEATDCKWLNSAAVLPLLVYGLKVFGKSITVNYINKANPSSTSVFIDCVSQVLTVVRNFSVVKSCKNELVKHEVVPLLCSLLGVYGAHSKVVVNCTRVLAKLSTDSDARAQMNGSTRHIKNLVDVVLREAGHSGASSSGANGGEVAVEWPGQHTWAILTRVSYTLGHLTTTNENNRALIGGLGLTGVSDRDKDDPLVDLLASCGLALDSMFQDEDDAGESDGSGTDQDDDGEQDNDSRSAERELVDATIKLVRLLANLSMDANIGRVLGSKNANALEMLVKMLVSVRGGGSAGQEELLLNVIAACTNLTYYSSKYINENTSPSSPRPGRISVSDKLLDLSQQLSVHLVTCLTTHSNSEVQLEAARVLGNLTRIESVRRTLIATYGADLLVDLLKHPESDVVVAVTGILVNLSADAECKQALLVSKATVPLSWQLRKAGLEDPELSTLICQALYNLLLNTPTADSEHLDNKLHSTLNTLINAGMDLQSEAAEADGGRKKGAEQEAQYQQCLSQYLKVGVAVMKLIAHRREST